MIRFETTIRQLTFSFPVFNASGVWCTSRKELEELGQSQAGAIVTKLMKKNLMQYMGISGLGGEGIKPIALAHVILFRHYSQDKLSIIGIGGVKTGSDVYQYILAGAKAVGIGTALLKEGPNIFQRLKKELMVILKRKKVKSLSEKIGQLKFS